MNECAHKSGFANNKSLGCGVLSTTLLIQQYDAIREMKRELAALKAERETKRNTGMALSADELYKTPRRINWSQVREGVPVMVWDRGTPCLRFYSKHDAACPKYPHRAIDDCGYKKASLVTGAWIFNHSGENPWPEGVLLTVIFRNTDEGFNKTTNSLQWETTGAEGDIIASRCTGLADGWEW